MYLQNQGQSIPPEILAELQYYRQLQQQHGQQQQYPNSYAPSHNNESLPQGGINSHERLSRSVSKRDRAKRVRSPSTDGRNEVDRGRSKRNKRGKSRRRDNSDSSESDTSDISDNKRHSSRKRSKKSRTREKSRAKSTRRSRSWSDRSKETRKEKERGHKKDKEKKKNSEHERGREKVRERGSDREFKDFNDKGSAGGRSRSRMRMKSPSSDRVTAIRSHSVKNLHTSHMHEVSNSDRDYDRGKSIQDSSRYHDSKDNYDHYRGRSLHDSNSNNNSSGTIDNNNCDRGKSVNNINNSSYSSNRSGSLYSDRTIQTLPLNGNGDRRENSIANSNISSARNRSTSRYAERTITTLPPDNHYQVHGKSVNNGSNSSSSINNNNSSGACNQDITMPFMPPPGLNGSGRGQHRTIPAWKSDVSLGGDDTTTSMANNTAANAFIASIGGLVIEKNECENMNNAKGRDLVRASGIKEGEETSVLVQAPNITSKNNSDVSPLIRDISSESAIQARIREKSLKKLALSQGKR
jgi:hypothetical protein